MREGGVSLDNAFMNGKLWRRWKLSVLFSPDWQTFGDAQFLAILIAVN
jgi:hypothetical protein